MRAYLPAYEMVVPKTLAEALSLLEKEPGQWKPFAGGTDLMVLFEAGKLSHRKFFSVWGLSELKGIEETATHLTLGALTTYAEVQSNDVIQREFPLLARAAAETGAIAIQNRGTLGGNIANASPAADSPPALLVYGAELELVSSHGSRWVSYEKFHLGYKKTALKPNELISRVRLARKKADREHYYRKVGTRKAQAISKVCFAAAFRVQDKTLQEVAIALGSVAPVPLRCFKTEAILQGNKITAALIEKAQRELEREVAPIDDIRSEALYRRKVAANLLIDCFEKFV